MNSLYGNFRTRKFTDIWSSANDFYEDYSTCGIPTLVPEADVKVLYYLLYAKYGNSHIASSDETQFAYQVFTIIYTDGVVWNKQRKKLEQLLALTDDEIREASININNHAYNPGEGGTSVTTEGELIGYINEQSASKTKRSKVDAFTMYNSLLQDNTNEFLNKFKKLFLAIVNPELPLWYVTEVDEEEEEDD